jgi:hypothetical protein
VRGHAARRELGGDRVRSRPHQRLQILDDRPESNRSSSKDFDACVARGSVT